MVIFSLILYIIFSASAVPVKTVEPPGGVMVAPGMINAHSVTILWDKPTEYKKVKRYEIWSNGKVAGTTADCNYKVNGLLHSRKYHLAVKSIDVQGKSSALSQSVTITTTAIGDTLDVTEFGAKGDTAAMNTAAIQGAIDNCPSGGVVYIPRGVFITGALFLKSNITLYIAEGGKLQGSTDPKDYEPFINNRFEGWELKTYASLLNAGTMDRRAVFTAENIFIGGKGTISGGGAILADSMVARHGIRSRGRLICLMNCRNVAIEGLNIENSPSWTIHYIYSKGISCAGLNISSNAPNGDGIDPDSSIDGFIFNCTFNTSDDCIAIKSGKNPEGYKIARPSENIFITNCNFIAGHGISIGSEMSGGVSNVLVRDCRAGNLIYGLQIKATKERGGFVRKVVVKDCDIQKITILSSVGYNNDGDAAPEMPFFKDFEFSDLDLSGADPGQTLIAINGFPDKNHYTQDLLFKNLLLPENSSVHINKSKSIKFVNVLSLSGKKPHYILDSTENVSF